MHLPAANFRFRAAVFTLCSPSPLWTLLPGRLSLPCPPFSRPSPFNPPERKRGSEGMRVSSELFIYKDVLATWSWGGRGDEVSCLDIYFYLRAASVWRRKPDVEVIGEKLRTIQTANQPWIYNLDILTRKQLLLTYVLSALIFCYPWNTQAAGGALK